MDALEPAPTRSKRRLVFGIVGGVVVVALIAAGALIIPRLLGNASASKVNLTASTMPPDTDIYFALNPRFDTLPNGDVVRKAWGAPTLFEPLEENIRDSLRNIGLDWEDDIAPWLGDEIGFGFSNVNFGPFVPDAPPPSMLAALVTRDRAASDAFLAKWRAALESKSFRFAETAYRDVPIVERVDTDRPGEQTAYATVENLVLITNSPATLRAAIDARLDGKGLDTQTRYASVVDKLRGGRAATLYVDAAAVVKPLLESGAPQSPQVIDPTNTQTLAMGVSFEPNGILAEFITIDDPAIPLPVEEETGKKAVPNPNRLLRAVPDSTILYLSGRRASDALAWILDAYRQAFAPLLSFDPNAQDPVTEFEQYSGIDIKRDVLGWMTGEAAFVMLPGSGFSGSGGLPFGFALIVEPSDKQAAEAGIDKLFRALADRTGGQLRIEDVTVAGVRLHGLVDEFSGDSQAVYGLIGDNMVVALPESAAQKIATAGDRPLADDADFQAAIAPLPRNTIGYIYFKPAVLIDLMSMGVALSGQACEACALFEPIESIAFTIEYPPAELGTVYSVMFLRLDIGK